MKLKKIVLSNFKMYKDFEKEFEGGVTEIAEINASGKTTLATAVLWTLIDSDFDLKKSPVVRREIDGVPVNDVPVEVELIFCDGTKDIAFKKVQKRTIKKDGSYADANTYFVNDVEVAMRDFNARAETEFGCSTKVLQMCLSINAFLNQKPDDMRKFLFEHVEGKSDLDIAASEEDLSDLRELLEKYTLEEVSSKYKASRTKIQKTLDDIPVMIAQEQKHIVELDTAEDELAIRGLEEEISNIDQKMCDAQELTSEIKKKTDDFMALQFKKTQMESDANSGLITKKREIQKELDRLQSDEYMAVKNLNVLENDLAIASSELKTHKEMLKECQKEYAGLMELEFDESMAFCPTCHQRLPEGDIEKLIQEFAVKTDEKRQSVRERGNMEKQTVVNLKDKIPALRQKISEAQAHLLILRGQIENNQSELAALPETADMSTDEAYQELAKQILDAEKAMSEENTTEDIIARLSARKRTLEAQLCVHKDRVSRVMKNAEHEEEISRLEDLKRKKEQDKANCQKILDQVEKLDKRKNELLVSDINSMFQIVKWKLFSYQKSNNAYVKCCIPLVDGFEFGKTTNKAREILAKVDIAVSVQNMFGTNIPIILDNAESLDRSNKDKLKEFGRQMILLCVKGD